MADDRDVDASALVDRGSVSGLQFRVFALCALVAMIDGYDIQAIGLALPGLVADWGIPPAQFSNVVAASVIGIALGGTVMAPMSDRYGRRPVLIAAISLLAVSTLGTAFSQGVTDLMAWRLLTGVALGGSIPVSLAMTSEFAPASRRAAIVLLMSCAIPVGSAAGSFLAPVIESEWGWRGILAVGGILPALAAIALWVGMPESLQHLLRHKPHDRRVASIALSIDPQVDPGRLRPAAAAHSKSSVLSLFSRELRARTLLFWLVFSANVFVNYYMINWLPTLLNEQGWTPAAAQMGASAYAMGGLIGGLGLTWLMAKANPIAVLSTTYGVTAIMFGSFLIVPDQQELWLAILLVAGCGGHGAALAILAVIATNYPQVVGATALGWAGSVARIGGIGASYAGAAMLSMDLAGTSLLGTMLVPAIACAVGIALLPLAVRAP